MVETTTSRNYSFKFSVITLKYNEIYKKNVLKTYSILFR